MTFEIRARKRIILRAFAFSQLLMLAPGASLRADTLSDIYQKLEQQPGNVSLNLQYAAEAERVGKLKWALPAYERALAADPGNNDALLGLERIRTKLRAEAEAR
jgi:hypothetical protein